MTIEIVRHWRVKKQRYQLAGTVCNDCGHKMFPPREVCPECARIEQSYVAVLPFAQAQPELLSVQQEKEPALV